MKRLHLKDAKGYSQEYLDWMIGKTVDWMVENRKSAFALIDWGKVADAICVAPYFETVEIEPKVVPVKRDKLGPPLPDLEMACPDVQRAENEGLHITGRDPKGEGLPCLSQ